MLVLTRKMQQKIKIGEGVTITILRIKGKQVQIGIEAPRDVRVLRAEVPEHNDGPQLVGRGGRTRTATPEELEAEYMLA